MLSKIGKGVLLAIGILMILSVTYWNPAEITEKAKKLFGLSTGPRADLEGLAPTTGREAVEEKENREIRRHVNDLREEVTRETIETLSTLKEGSRVVGYGGHEAAAQYVEDAFLSIGLQDVASQYFDVTVPKDEGGSIAVLGSEKPQTMGLYALWPNEVRTSSLPPSFEGTLIDGGEGEFRDFNGKRLTRIEAPKGGAGEGREVADAVVLLRFDCGQNWMKAAMLGAKAVVFFDNTLADSILITERTERRLPAGQPGQHRECVKELRKALKEQIEARKTVRAALEKDKLETYQEAAKTLAESQQRIADSARAAAGEVELNEKTHKLLELARRDIEALIREEGSSKGEMILCRDDAKELAEQDTLEKHRDAYGKVVRRQDKIVVRLKRLLGMGPEAVTRGEAEQKFAGVPANVPRFWIDAEDARVLRHLLAGAASKRTRVALQSRMVWSRVRTRNIIGVIPGTLPPRQPSDKVDYKRKRIIVISAFYDSMSMVPALAPGAENACGLAALLQTARVLKKFPPRHTIVFLATSGHFHAMWGVQEFLRQSLPTSDELERDALPRGRWDFDLFIGLDLTSRGQQVATACFGTFYNRYWEMDVYRKNLLAPYAKHFTEYAARIFRKKTSEATCPHINAITPPKKTWKNFVPRPVAFDAEAVIARGKDAVAIFTPHEIRDLVDTPNDTLHDAVGSARLDLQKLHTQVKTVAALIAKAGRDVQFFTDSKLHLENRIRATRGNVTWFDRAVNPNIPKAPVGGAVVTLRHPAAGVTAAGVRTLYTVLSQPGNPQGGDTRNGYYIENVTLNARRVRVNVWAEDIGEPEDGEVEIQTHKWLVHHKLTFEPNGPVTIDVRQRFVLDEEGKVEIPETSYGEALVGRWETQNEAVGKRTGRFVPPQEDYQHDLPPGEDDKLFYEGRQDDTAPAATILVAEQRSEEFSGRWEAVPDDFGRRTGPLVSVKYDDARSAPPKGVVHVMKGGRVFRGRLIPWAHIQVGNARFRGPIVVPPRRFEAEIDLQPPGWLDRTASGVFSSGVPEVEHDAADPDVDPATRIIRSMVIRGKAGRTYEVSDIDVAFGQFEGQFTYPFVYFWRWGTMPLLAYKLDERGSIIYAEDEGSQGKETYPNDVRHGGGAQCVLFRCKPLTILEIVDSRYLTVLDQVGILGPENSVPQQWGARFIPGQSRQEGLVTSAAVVFAKHDTARGRVQPVKIHMGTGLYGIKLLLTNAGFGRDGEEVKAEERFLSRNLHVTRDEARGNGYVADGGVLLRPTFRVAWDMWVLNEYRLRELDRYGISNPMLGTFPKEGEAATEGAHLGLHDRARIALIAAQSALDKLDYETFMAESRRAWGYEAKAYPDVASQADDTVKGVVFYFVLLIPFAFFMERLLIGAADIRKRIAGFAVIFLVVFVVLRLVHPAFKLSSSPYIILLAFIILAMGVIVLFIVVNKFNVEIRKMKQAAQGIQQADVGRLSASYAAVMLGISNLRKRKIRTTLTAVTLTLLTFTVLSFTSINRSLGIFRLSRGNKPAYEGALVRDRNWRSLQNVVLDYLRSEFKDKEATVAPRAWLISKSKKEKEFFEFSHAGGRSNVNGIVGLTPQEAAINPATGPQTLLLPGGRWFEEGDRHACILPDDVAARVGIKPDDLVGKTDEQKPRIEMHSHEFVVIGLIDSKKLNTYRDIDDEKLTPVDTLAEAAKMDVQENPDEAAKAPIQAFTHMEASNVMFVPYAYAMNVGGTLRSIALSRFDEFVPSIRKFMQRVALNIFVAQGRGEAAKVEVLSSIQTTSFSGLGNLFVPILIAALIVLNTMTGSVYERFHEIHIYSSVGLAPTHIAALFLAESAVFATIGAVAGYLVGQTVAGILVHFGWLGSITLNYSSLSTIYSSVVVMLTVFLSAIYPAKKASDMAVPDVTRRWEFPPPEGDDWVFDFPFTVSGVEILGQFAYLARFLQSYGETSIGAFYTEDVSLTKASPEDKADYVIAARCWLAPYDLGISQDVLFEAVPAGEHNIYAIVHRIHRLSGDTLSWQRMNRGFLNVLRKQFLVWRTVPSGTKLEFAEEGKRIVGELAPEESAAEATP